MKLRYKIPFRLDLYAPDKRTTTIRTEFTHANLRCNMSLSGEKSRSFDDIEPGDDEDLTKIIAEIPTDQRWFKSVTHLQIEIEDVGKKRLETLVETRDFSKLYKLLRTLGNRCIRAFRNFGMIAEIREIPPGGEEKPEIGLRSWLVEIRKNGHDWEKLVSGGGLREILRTLQPQRVPNFKPERWSMIEEAIQDDVAPDPEQEFTVNALEHLDSGNYRSAVMESIIALEITLTSFIREYLANYKGMSEQQINRFLSPNLTLDMRLAGVVQLMLDESELRMFHMDKILQAVHWRNSIVHKTGHLPEEPVQKYRDAVNNVLGFAIWLGYKGRSAAALPEIRGFSQKLNKTFGLPIPKLSLLPNHRVEVEFLSSPFDVLTTERQSTAVREVIGFCQSRDPRFQAENHLTVKFFKFPHEMYSRWQHGRLEELSH